LGTKPAAQLYGAAKLGVPFLDLFL
jgi:hypothetical protein